MWNSIVTAFLRYLMLSTIGHSPAGLKGNCSPVSIFCPTTDVTEILPFLRQRGRLEVYPEALSWFLSIFLHLRFVAAIIRT